MSATQSIDITEAVQRSLRESLGSAARVKTALEILQVIRTRPDGSDAWIKHRYIDHLSALTQAGLIEYEPGIIDRHGSITYRCRPNKTTEP